MSFKRTRIERDCKHEKEEKRDTHGIANTKIKNTHGIANIYEVNRKTHGIAKVLG